jgi:antitoxin VapB
MPDCSQGAIWRYLAVLRQETGKISTDRNQGTLVPLSITETERLACELAKRTGETLTVATRRALEERLRRVSGAASRAALLEDLAASCRHWSKMRVLDSRSPDEIIGYDENGLPR